MSFQTLLLCSEAIEVSYWHERIVDVVEKYCKFVCGSSMFRSTVAVNHGQTVIMRIMDERQTFSFQNKSSSTKAVKGKPGCAVSTAPKSGLVAQARPP